MKKVTKTGEAPKEHKQPWQEKYATPEEIKAMLSERVMLRYNEVRGRTEVHYLSDTTGTRRWLPFEIESIESPLSSPFDYDGIYAQAYALYHQGFRYWFDRQEIERLQRHNEQFESPCTERELVFWNFRKPVGSEQGEFMPVGLAMQIVSGQISAKISKEQMGHAFISLGFERKTYRNVRGYVVVRRSSAEIERLRRELVTDHTHTPDTLAF